MGVVTDLGTRETVSVRSSPNALQSSRCPGQNGEQLLFQPLQLGIDVDGQGGGGGGQEHGDDSPALVVAFIGDFQRLQQEDDQDNGNEEGIGHRGFQPAVDRTPQLIAEDAQGDAEKRG